MSIYIIILEIYNKFMYRQEKKKKDSMNFDNIQKMHTTNKSILFHFKIVHRGLARFNSDLHRKKSYLVL